MDLEYFIERLSTNREVFQGLVKGTSLKQGRWKPTPDKWSILEVINHLYDEEREDFRQRLNLVLANPEQAWPRIDPQDWVTSRGYNERDLESSISNFLTERQKSLFWLGTWRQQTGRTVTNTQMVDASLPGIFLHPGWLTTTFTFGNWRDFIGSMLA